jgi:hypothetical protein
MTLFLQPPCRAGGFDNPPAAADADALARFAAIGLVPGKPFDLANWI